MQATLKSFEITAQSAWSTLQILDRQAHRDCAKIARFAGSITIAFTSRDAIRTYRAIGRLCVIAGMVAIALGYSARDAWEWFLRENAAPQPIAEQAVTEFDPVLENAAEPVSDPVLGDDIKSVPSIIDAIVPFVRPQPSPVTVDWAILSPYDLRKACQARGIKWRSAHGKNKHLSKAEMVAALSAAPEQVA